MIQKRDLVGMLILFLVTFGLYSVYWFYQTKKDINSVGGSIPTFLLFCLPFFNIYFLYCYGQDFTEYIKRDKSVFVGLCYFFLLLFFPIISCFIIQYELNRYQP